MSAYPCNCTPKHLLEAGCTCGAWLAEKQDREAVERVALHEARERLQRQADFLIGQPTPPVTFKASCPTCPHPKHTGPGSPWQLCPERDCQCAG